MIEARRVLAAVALGALALSGCSAQAPGVAARVDGVALPEADVLHAAQAVAAAQQKADASVFVPQVANFYVQGLVAAKVGAAHGVPVSDATRQPIIAGDQFLSQYRQAGGEAFVNRIADVIYVRQQLGDQKFLEGCALVPVSVNPHYGNWSKQLCATDGQSGSMARPATPLQP